jgi:hydroxyethylthiazole kinase-like sugar kinase family protein
MMVAETGAVRMVAGGDEGIVITSGGSLLRAAVVVGCVEFRVYGLSWG